MQIGVGIALAHIDVVGMFYHRGHHPHDGHHEHGDCHMLVVGGANRWFGLFECIQITSG